MRCLIAVEDNIATTIRENLKKLDCFRAWEFEECTNGTMLDEWAGKAIDVLVLSRFLPGSDPIRLLSGIRHLFPSAHIVLLVGEITESCRAYTRAASKSGLHNVVAGKLPGDRPYTIMTALTRPRKPELDGYEELRHVTEPVASGASQAAEISTKEAVSKPPKGWDRADHECPEELMPRSLKTITASGLLVISAANKGGVGKTTAAVATATALARAGIATVLVDLDLGGPNIAAFLKLKGVYGIEQLSGMNHSRAQVDKLLVKKEEHLYVLPGVMNKTLPYFESGSLAAVMNCLKNRFSVVVCDTSPEPWTKQWLYEVFEMADVALAVVDQSLLSQEETRLYAPTLLSMGVTPEKIQIVLNRFSPNLHNVRVIEAAFCHGFKKDCKTLPRVVAKIPQDWNAAVLDTYKGEIAALGEAGSEWHKLAKGIADLAGYCYELKHDERARNDPGRQGLFAKLCGVKR